MPGNCARHAACAGRCKSIFFPADYQNNRQWILAKRICAVCPVSTDCLNYALDHEEFGIWGGLTPFERDKVRSVIGPGNRVAS